ncbi:hypothetical protein BDY21DRAFT_378828 [Lineolata rhizophorae]|uniref:Uncharacterized protein n=1 Tax=Lineolata rhizophorae TaxID=578093 RepID=A0A6A6P0Z0_9PEZI|nr:hypothetical protein BDY21DRAFT_378828 [Lineolata rhizophorae]
MVLKALRRALHPQLPLSPRQSQQLLAALTSSFRAHLDRHHPAPGARRVADRASAQSSVDRHLASIFAHSRPTPTAARVGSLFELISTPASVDPSARLDALDRKLAALLHALVQGAERPAAPPLREAAASTNAGSAVLSWVRASGLEFSPELISHARLARSLSYFLSAEERYDVLNGWLGSSVSLSSRLTAQAVRQWKIRSLRAFVQAEFDFAGTPSLPSKRPLLADPTGNGLLKAIPVISHAGSLAEVDSHDYRSNTSATNLRHVLQPVLVDLADSISLSLLRVDSVDPALYDDLVSVYASLRQLAISTKIAHASVVIRHPDLNSRDIDLALETLKEMDGLASGSNFKSFGKRGAIKRMVIQLALDAAQELLHRKRDLDAAWVLSYASRAFSDEFGQNEARTEDVGLPLETQSGRSQDYNPVGESPRHARDDDSSVLEMLRFRIG